LGNTDLVAWLKALAINGAAHSVNAVDPGQCKILFFFFIMFSRVVCPSVFCVGVLDSDGSAAHYSRNHLLLLIHVSFTQFTFLLYENL